MIERIGSSAEKLATNISESRRGFLIRAGKVALVAAGAVGGLLALPREAQAAGYHCCTYVGTGPGGGGYMRRCYSYACPQHLPLFWNLYYSSRVASCSQCPR